MHNKQTIILLNARKMFCDNPECSHKTFSERFDFVNPKGKKTKRLIEKILITSSKLSSVNASTLLKTDSIKACKRSIWDLLKKCQRLWINLLSPRFVWMILHFVKDIVMELLWSISIHTGLLML